MPKFRILETIMEEVVHTTIVEAESAEAAKNGDYVELKVLEPEFTGGGCGTAGSICNSVYVEVIEDGEDD